MGPIPLIPIGSAIGIDINTIKDRLSEELFNEISKYPQAQITDYKMTDGKGIGYVIKLRSNKEIWVFTSELDLNTKQKFDIDTLFTDSDATLNSELIVQTIEKITSEVTLNGSKNIKYLMNPLNFIKWILYTSKDII